jgi:WD40 repeat protein
MSGPRLVRVSGPPVIEPVTPLVTARLPSEATALVVLPDGDSCVAATDRGLFVVSLSTGNVVPVAARGLPARLSLTASGRIVTADRFELLVWDPDSWTVARRLEYKGRALADVAASDEFVVAGGWDGAWVWDTGTGRRRHALTDGEVMAVAVSADGRHAATLERNRQVMLWDLRQGTPLRMLRAPDPEVPPIDWERPVDWEWELPLDEAYWATASVDPANDRLVIADGGLAVGLLTERDGLRPWVMTSRTRVAAVRPSDGLIAAAIGERIQLLNLRGEVADVLGPASAPVRALAFAPDGRLVSSQTIPGVTVWPVIRADQQPARQVAHTTAVWRTVIDRTGRYGRSIDGDGQMRLWDLRTGECLTGAGLDASLGQGSWFLPNGGASMVAEYGVEHRLDSEDRGCSVTVEDVFDDDGRPRTKTVCCRNQPGGEVRWTWTASPAGTQVTWWQPAWVVLPRHSDVVLVCTKDHDAKRAQVVILDQATGQCRSQFAVRDGQDARPQTLPDGSVCLRYQDYSVTPSVLRLALLDWRAGTVEPYARLTGCGNAMITADGLIVAVIGNEIRLVEPGGGQPVAHVTTPAKIKPWALAISPDGRLILAGDIQGGVHILHTPPA